MGGMSIPITQEDLEEFKAIYREEYGAEISDAEALEIGTRLLRVVKVCGKEERVLTGGPKIGDVLGRNCLSREILV